MPVYEVGKKVCEPCATDTIQFDIQDDGALFVAKLGRPTNEEVQEFKKGKPQFKFLQLDGVIYVLAKYGSLEWMEAPFHRDAAINTTKLPNPQDGEGLSLHIMLIDASTGVLKAQRLIGLSTQFTKKLVDAILKQPPMTYSQYIASVNKAHMKYTIDQMVGLAKETN